MLPHQTYQAQRQLLVEQANLLQSLKNTPGDQFPVIRECLLRAVEEMQKYLLPCYTIGSTGNPFVGVQPTSPEWGVAEYKAKILYYRPINDGDTIQLQVPEEKEEEEEEDSYHEEDDEIEYDWWEEAELEDEEPEEDYRSLRDYL